MEVKREVEPNKGYLQKIRKLCNKRGIVLIFDECTSGFRESYGGLHKLYGVNPDIAIFEKPWEMVMQLHHCRKKRNNEKCSKFFYK